MPKIVMDKNANRTPAEQDAEYKRRKELTERLQAKNKTGKFSELRED